MNLSTENLFPQTAREIGAYIRSVPDFPRPGIDFKDISPLLAEPAAFKQLIKYMEQQVRKSGATTIVGLEARGFLLGIALAQEMGLPFVPARKAGKLPGEVRAVDYSLEYGTARLEIQTSAIKPGQRVAIVDDLLATGGTARAAARLIEELGAEVAGAFFAIELRGLAGRGQLRNVNVNTVLTY